MPSQYFHPETGNPITRQRWHQLKFRALGLCTVCGKPAAPMFEDPGKVGRFCLRHALKFKGKKRGKYARMNDTAGKLITKDKCWHYMEPSQVLPLCGAYPKKVCMDWHKVTCEACFKIFCKRGVTEQK